MRVSINKDMYGIQLCTDYEECDNCLDLRFTNDIEDIREACDEWLKENRERK